MSNSRAIQKHMRYHAYGKHGKMQPQEQLKKIAESNPGILMNAIATLSSDPENGITRKDAYDLVKKYLISKGRLPEFQSPKTEEPDCTELVAAGT